MNSRFKFFLILILLAVISINYGDGLRGFAVDVSTFVIKKYEDIRSGIANTASEHFYQRDEIRRLREENEKLGKNAELSIAFASKLNALLEEANVTAYSPNLKLVRALSYAKLGDYNKVWLDFAEFDANKIYGLTYRGFSAGIVTASEKRPLALLQHDPKSAFSVYMGESRVKGIAFGADDKIEVRYIPLWAEIKIDDEVITSGLDNIFYEGIKVGKVVEVNKEESYFTAVVETYADIDIPEFFHAVIL